LIINDIEQFVPLAHELKLPKRTKNVQIMMENIRNNNREQIISLLEKAENRIQIAVSWLTDEVLINKLAETAQKKKVELLLSCDALNVWRYSAIRDLQFKGAKVLKTGTNSPGVKGFMHAKFMIIDGTHAYGGSFNFTDGANYNYENFAKYDDDTVQSFSSKFQNWWANAKDYTVDFENPDAIKKLVVQSFELQEQMQESLLANFNSEQQKFIAKEVAERDALIKAEIEKEQKREAVRAMQSASATVSKTGTMTTQILWRSVANEIFWSKIAKLFSLCYASKKRN
jgi:hypothetical protein